MVAHKTVSRAPMLYVDQAIGQFQK